MSDIEVPDEVMILNDSIFKPDFGYLTKEEEPLFLAEKLNEIIRCMNAIKVQLEEE